MNVNKDHEKMELLYLISMALEVLDFIYKDAFLLREYYGLSYEEIAEVSEISLNNAKSRVFRAKIKIRKTLKPYISELESY